MDYRYLDKQEYRDIPIFQISDNKNNLPFFVVRSKKCNQSMHRHEFVQIIYVWKGKLKHVINQTVFDVQKGDIFVIPPFCPHSFLADRDQHYEFVELEFVPEFINERFSPGENNHSFMDFAYLEPFLVTEHEVKPRLHLGGRIQLETEQILEEILREYEARDVDFEAMIKALLLKLLILVGREFRREISETEYQALYQCHREAFLNVIRYAEENYDKEVSVEEAARIAMLSQSYFRYLFKQITQKTWGEYIQRLRLAKAAELLQKRKDLRIIDICYGVGYNNISHFNRIFRQETGVSPSEFRKR